MYTPIFLNQRGGDSLRMNERRRDLGGRVLRGLCSITSGHRLAPQVQVVGATGEKVATP